MLHVARRQVEEGKPGDFPPFFGRSQENPEKIGKVPKTTEKAKSGNLTFFCVFCPFSLKIAGKTREKRAKCPEKGLDYQILP